MNARHFPRHLFLATTLTLAACSIPASEAVQFSDGTVHFDRPPRLVNAATTNSSTNVPIATYYFTVEVPENAGEPLQRLIIDEYDGSVDLRYRLDKTIAFEGTHRNKGEAIAISAVDEDRDNQLVSVTFDPPISPGTTVTVGLRPRRNPSVGSVVLFGVTAFPAGEKTASHFMGFGRLHFYSDGDGAN